MPLNVFISYSYKDDKLRERLETSLAVLKRNGDIEVWGKHQILPGSERNQDIQQELDRAHIILLLVSPEFLASDYCYDNVKKNMMVNLYY